ncbi:MAG: hypothetical protein IT317_21060 [Anaerolineales bacterium]|nr:hypothetical protein [Anaerolineales bacterium]
MNTQRWVTQLLSIGLALGLAGCGAAPTTTPTAAPLLTPTELGQASTPGAAATATYTAAPTATTAPTHTVVPPTPTPIGLLTLTEAGRLGRGQAFQMAWSPDATRLAIGSSVGAYVLDATSLDVLAFLPTDGPVYLVRYSADGQWLAGGGVRAAPGGDLGVAWVWSTSDGALRHTLPIDYWLNDLAVDKTGALLAVGGLFPTTQAQVWDLNSEAPLYTATLERGGAAVGANQSAVGVSVAFSPDGGTLALAGGAAGVTLYQARTGELQGALPGPAGPSYDLAYSANGKRLAVGSTQQAVVWDVPGRTLALTVTAESEVWHVAFSANGRRLALTSGSAVQVVDAASGALVRSLPTEGPVLSVAFGTGGAGAELVRAVDVGQTYAWEAGSGAAVSAAGGPLSGFTGPVQGMAFLPNGALLSSELDTLRVWDVARQTSDRAWDVAAEGQPAAGPDGKEVASGYCEIKDNFSGACALHLVGVWDAASGEQIRSLQAHTQTVNAVAYSPDGRWLASAADDGAALWNALDGALVYTLTAHTAPVAALAFAPDSRTLATAGYDGQVIVWDVAAGTPRTTLTLGAPVYALAFSPDGTLLATGSAAPDSQVRLWRVADGAVDPNPLAELAGHTGDVRALAFAPSGAWLVSGGAPAPTGPDDETVRVWTLAATGAEEAQVLRPDLGAVFGLAWSPDGKTLAAGGSDGVVTVWNAEAAP